MRALFGFAAAVLALGMMQHAVADDIEVRDAWVRGTVSAQKVSGAYMTISAKSDVRLTGASSSIAEVTELHEMLIENDVMKMRRIDGLDIPAGTTVEFKPQGHHIMLMGLKHALAEGDHVVLTVIYESADGSRVEKQINAPVRPLNATGDVEQPMGHGNMDHGDTKKGMH